MVIIAALIAMLIPPFQAAKLAARRTHRVNALKNVGLSLQNFQDTYRRLPPAIRRDDVGRPVGSWRYQIVPFMEALMLGIDYRKPWFDPAVRILSSREPDYYCFDHDRSRHYTNVAVICGPGTPFDDSRTCSLEDLDDDTILAVEVAELDVHWMEPGDLHIDSLPESLMKGLDGQGVLVVFADSTVQYVPKSVPLENLRKLMTIEGAKQHDRKTLLPQ